MIASNKKKFLRAKSCPEDHPAVSHLTGNVERCQCMPSILRFCTFLVCTTNYSSSICFQQVSSLDAIVYIVVIIDINLVYGTHNVAERGLNQEHFENVLDVSLPLLPIGGRDETLYDHAEHDEVVFLDKECARNESYADHLRRELLLEQRCFFENAILPGIVDGDNYYHFYLQWNDSNAVDCTQGVTIDFEAFCISMIEYEPIFYRDDLRYECDSEPAPTEDGTWWINDITAGSANQDDYYYPYVIEDDDFNLIVYVVDTLVMLDHEHFEHIRDKKYLGDHDPTLYDHHGTHVAGLIVGDPYGVIQDKRVKLRACSFVLCVLCVFYLVAGLSPLHFLLCLSVADGCTKPDKSCPASSIQNCLELILGDFKEEHANTAADKVLRGVINISIGAAGCGRNYFTLITECMCTLVLEVVNLSHSVLRRYTVLVKWRVVTVVSAGNDNDNACTRSPACFDSVITVGAYDVHHNRAQFDSKKASNYGDCVNAWGPGLNIYSAKASNTEEYGMKSGTSMASPIIAGMVGQFMNVKPDITLEPIKEFLADDVVTDHEDYDNNIYSFLVNDCRSAQCRAFSMDCDDFAFIASAKGTERPTSVPRPTLNPTQTTNMPSPSPTGSPSAAPSGAPSPPTMPSMDI